jgi:hypothetical protein
VSGLQYFKLYLFSIAGRPIIYSVIIRLTLANFSTTPYHGCIRHWNYFHKNLDENKTFNVCNCFSFKLILVSLNNGQLMYGKPCTVFKWQPCWELFFKAQGFPYQLSHNHITNVTSIHILCGLVQLNLDEDQGIVQGLLTEWLLHGRNVLIWPSTKFEGHSGLMTTCAISAYHQVIWIKSSYA